MGKFDQSELALIQRQCEAAHIAHPTADLGLALWPTRLPDFNLPNVYPFNRDDAHVFHQYDHSGGYVRIYFFGSDEALELYTNIVVAVTLALPSKTDTVEWSEHLFEQRVYLGIPFDVRTDEPRFVHLRENPFLSSAMAIEKLKQPAPIDSAILRQRSLDALREKFETAAERSPKARHSIAITDAMPNEREQGGYWFKTPEGRWWVCSAANVNISEFSTLCREAAHICEDDPRCSLMSKPRGILAHDDAWMMFVHRLAWREPAGSALRAFMEMTGRAELSGIEAQQEPLGLRSELRPNLYTACAMAIDVVMATPMPGASSTPATGVVQGSNKPEWPPGEWRTAAWFRTATKYGIDADMLRKAAMRNSVRRLRLSEAGDWRYEVDSVTRYWSKYRVQIEAQIQSESATNQADQGGRKRTNADGSGQVM